MVLSWMSFASLLHQEYNTLKKFGDSLLTKSTKLVDLSGQIDEAVKNSDANSAHGERAKKCFGFEFERPQVP